MPEAQKAKNHFQLNKGLNTESGEISFPDGYSVDERNYELLVDGSRRRRKGLAQESGGASHATGLTIGTSDAYTTYKWRGVGGDPTKNFIVHQIGATLQFTDDSETLSTTYNPQVTILDQFAVDIVTNPQATIATGVCQFAQGRGVLLVTQQYLRPFYVSYNLTTNEFTYHPISIQVRDFDGIDDGLPFQSTPSVIDDDHRYNLRNRGWIEFDIESGSSPSYFDVQGNYPSKAMIWYKGYRRITDVGYSDLDGIQEFDSAKLVGERFGQSSAPQGALLLDPLDTRYSGSTTNEGDEVLIDSITVSSGTYQTGSVITIVTEAVHGRDTGDFVTMSGTQIGLDYFIIQPVTLSNLNGYHEITVSDTTTFTITYPAYPGTDLEWGTVTKTGQINGNVSLPKSDGKALSAGPTACAYFAGRAWFAGIQDGEWADTVFFSKIAQKPAGFSACHQEADPTNPEFNMLSSSDGGTVVIPNLGNVQRMLTLKDALIIYSDRGIWEIGGGRRGLFTASQYSVRKITEAECSSGRSPIVIGNRSIYTGPRGIHVLAPNKYTRVIEESSLSDQLVLTLWNAIPEANQSTVQTVHDSALNRVYFLYGDSGDNTNHYANTLVLDLRVGAYYKYVFNTTAATGLLGAFSITDSDSAANNKKIKWTAQSTNSLVTCDLNQTDYIDFNGAESPLPYVVTGWDNLGDFQRRRQAPVITVFAKRTETGYIAAGDGWDGVNESSNLLTAYWDWTDDDISGKIGSQNETYRHTRAFVPSAADDVSGYPVVTTRNKIRGRGRVLQLRFDGAATKDSHILGFTTNYKVSRGK